MHHCTTTLLERQWGMETHEYWRNYVSSISNGEVVVNSMSPPGGCRRSEDVTRGSHTRRCQWWNNSGVMLTLVSVLLVVSAGHVSGRGVFSSPGGGRGGVAGGSNGAGVIAHRGHSRGNVPDHRGNVGSAHHREDLPGDADGTRELWLNDFTKDFLDEMQADGGQRASKHSSPSGRTRAATCPPPFLQVPRDACRVVTCTSDTECHVTGQKCCNNGCTFTCMDAMPPPPLVDWRKEPPRKGKGISWLLPTTNNSENFQAEHCSTSQLNADEDVLLCPHGYICHIELLGDAARGIPNRGRCVPEVHDAQGSTKTRFRIRTEEDESTDACRIPHRGAYPNGARFRYEKHVCTCRDGSVECQVGRGRGK